MLYLTSLPPVTSDYNVVIFLYAYIHLHDSLHDILWITKLYLNCTLLTFHLARQVFAGLWSLSRRLGLETYQRLVSVSSREKLSTSRSRLGLERQTFRSRPFTSRAQDQFSAKLCRPHLLTLSHNIHCTCLIRFSSVAWTFTRYSALRPLARKIFTVPASSAASERV